LKELGPKNLNWIYGQSSHRRRLLLLAQVALARERDFKRPGGSEGFTAKGLATGFTGVGIDQTSVPGEIMLDMRGCAADIVKKYGFLGAQRASTPGVPGRIISETDCACPGDADAPDPPAFRSPW
jgi:hypothetical protein